MHCAHNFCSLKTTTKLGLTPISIFTDRSVLVIDLSNISIGFFFSLLRTVTFSLKGSPLRFLFHMSELPAPQLLHHVAIIK